ncbi:hypothetical protein BDZ91DRAFT_742267, partial [Kalaharituber pfeilii]
MVCGIGGGFLVSSTGYTFTSHKSSCARTGCDVTKKPLWFGHVSRFLDNKETSWLLDAGRATLTMEMDAASSIESWKATTDIAICRSCGHTYPHFELRILLQLALSILFLT